MNKKFVILLFCALSTGICVFIDNAGAQKEPKPAAQAPALTGEEKLAQQRAVFTEKARQALTGKEWAVYVTAKPATEKKPAVIETDTLSFTERTVLSKNLSSQGYSKGGSNYALSVADDGSGAVWETMQMRENEMDIAYLRGELDLKSGVMRGSILYKSAQGKDVSCGYSTIAPIAETAPEPAQKKAEEGKKSKKKAGK